MDCAAKGRPALLAVGEPQEVDFVLRETARKFQFNISQLTLWRRVR